MKKIIALVTVFALVAALLCACGGDKEGSADVKGEESTWGNITVLVPEGFTLNGGDLIDKENPDKLTLQSPDNAFNYINISIVEDEESAKSSIETTKEYNEGTSDAAFTAGANWTGVSYESIGYDCFQVYGTIGDKIVLAGGAGFKTDDATLNAVLASIKVS